MTTRVMVNPDLLHWALGRVGLTPDALAGKFPKLGEWLRGELAPTLKQLESFANATHTAIGLLFLPEPPEEPLPIPDFRTMPEARLSRPSADLLDTIYLCQQRQEWYRDYQRLHAADPVAFVDSAAIHDDVVEVAGRMAEALHFDITERQKLSNWTDALRGFIGQAEDAGVLVMVSGVVGSNTHRALNPQEFRGFALADNLAPLVFINGKDSKAAQMFTLAHELAHLCLGESGVSDTQAASLPDQATEQWCNAVAAELLVPLAEVRRSYEPINSLHKEMQRLARQFKVSTLVIIRRLFDMGAIDEKTLWDTYREEVLRLKALSVRQSGGGDFYNSLGARVSKRFARALVASTLEGQTLFGDAFRMLGVRKSATFYKEASKLGLRP